MGLPSWESTISYRDVSVTPYQILSDVYTIYVRKSHKLLENMLVKFINLSDIIYN